MTVLTKIKSKMLFDILLPCFPLNPKTKINCKMQKMRFDMQSKQRLNNMFKKRYLVRQG